MILRPDSCSLVLAPAFVGGSRAQEPRQRVAPDPQTTTFADLTRDNYDHVAASGAQIKQLLINDPGMLVELKRSIAKEAGDTGRIVTDEALTDEVFFDHLTTDVKFRSVATRLVQGYGYLRPMEGYCFSVQPS